MIIRVKKFWLGNVSLRDYQIEEAIKRRQNIVVKIEDQQMTLPYQNLRRILRESPKTVVRSKFVIGQEYSLVDVPWRPDKEPPEPTTIHLETKLRLAEDFRKRFATDRTTKL